jgi:hypothetical protein
MAFRARTRGGFRTRVLAWLVLELDRLLALPAVPAP